MDTLFLVVVNGSFDWQLNVTTLLDVATNIKDAFLYINITPSGMSFNASDVTLNIGKDSIMVANLTVPKSVRFNALTYACTHAKIPRTDYSLINSPDVVTIIYVFLCRCLVIHC